MTIIDSLSCDCLPIGNYGASSQVALVVKNPPANAGDLKDVGSIPGLGRSSGEGHGNPLQYSCLENSMDRGALWATVHWVEKNQTWLKQLSRHTCNMIVSSVLHWTMWNIRDWHWSNTNSGALKWPHLFQLEIAQVKAAKEHKSAQVLRTFLVKVEQIRLSFWSLIFLCFPSWGQENFIFNFKFFGF